MKSLRWLSAKGGSALAAGLFLALLSVGPGFPQSPLRVGVVVAIPGAPAVSAHIRREMPDHLREALAGRPLNAYPPGSRLTVRVEEVYLSHDGNLPFAGGGRGGMKMPDFISGSMQVTDARGRVLFERRLEVASPVQAGGPAFRADNEMRRVSAMMAAMADWAVRSAQR